MIKKQKATHIANAQNRARTKEVEAVAQLEAAEVVQAKAVTKMKTAANAVAMAHKKKREAMRDAEEKGFSNRTRTP